MISQPEQRIRRVREVLKLIEECDKRGTELSPVVYYSDDEIFAEVVTRESEAERMLSVERDIITALTFLRWRQNNPGQAGNNNADLDYRNTEY